MDLEKAYNKIDNLCCLNSTIMQTIKLCLEQNLNIDPAKIDFFKAYKETNGDEDFCKDANEMMDALETIKNLVDLQKELGCPLEVLLKAISNGIYVKESNPSEALREIESYINNITFAIDLINQKQQLLTNIGIIKQALTTKSKKELAFDIIKAKKVYIKDLLMSENAHEYNIECAYECEWLTDEEFELLKDVVTA